VELHRTGAPRSGLGAQLQGAAERCGRVAHPKRHGARRWTMLACESLCQGLRFGVDDEVDLTLAVQRDVLGAMARDYREPQPLEQRAQQLRVGRGVFDEFETICAHGIVMHVAHRIYPCPFGTSNACRGIPPAFKPREDVKYNRAPLTSRICATCTRHRRLPEQDDWACTRQLLLKKTGCCAASPPRASR